MSTIQIDRLLETTIKKGASDLHISVGRPPVLRLHGGLRDLATKILEPDDTVALMKSITPDRRSRNLQEMGSADFGFAFASADGPARARFRVSVFRQKGNIGMVLRKIPYKLLTFEQIGLPAGSRRTLPPSARHVPGHRADGLGQNHDAGVDDQLHQHQL